MKKIIGISLFSMILASCGSNESTESNVSVDSVTVEFEFEVDDEIYDIDEEVLEETIEFEAGTSLLEAMEEQYEIVDEEGFITSIDGYEQDESANAYWLYDINDEMAQVGAAEYMLEDDDKITWSLNPSE